MQELIQAALNRIQSVNRGYTSECNDALSFCEATLMALSLGYSQPPVEHAKKERVKRQKLAERTAPVRPAAGRAPKRLEALKQAAEPFINAAAPFRLDDVAPDLPANVKADLSRWLQAHPQLTHARSTEQGCPLVFTPVSKKESAPHTATEKPMALSQGLTSKIRDKVQSFLQVGQEFTVPDIVDSLCATDKSVNRNVAAATAHTVIKKYFADVPRAEQPNGGPRPTAVFNPKGQRAS